MFSFVRPTDGLTPAEVYLKLGGGENTFLFESAGGLPGLCEYSFIGIDAKEVIRTNGSNPIPLLKEAVARWCQVLNYQFRNTLSNGAFGYMSYDVARYFENIPEDTVDDLDVPESVFVIPSVLVVFSHADDTMHILAETDRRLKEIVEMLENPVASTSPSHVWIPRYARNDRHSLQPKQEVDATISSNMTMDEYMDIVEKAKEYIFAGDINTRETMRGTVLLEPRMVFKKGKAMPAYSRYHLLPF